MSDEKLEELIDGGITLHDGSHSVSEDAMITRKVAELMNEVFLQNNETYDILTEEEIAALLEVVNEEPDEYILEDDEPRRFNFVEVMSWMNRVQKGYSHYPQRIYKDSWTDDRFIYYVSGSTFNVNRPPLLGIYEEGKEINYKPHIDMCFADNQVVVWTPTTEDLFSEDYYIKELNTGDEGDEEPTSERDDDEKLFFGQFTTQEMKDMANSVVVEFNNNPENTVKINDVSQWNSCCPPCQP